MQNFCSFGLTTELMRLGKTDKEPDISLYDMQFSYCHYEHGLTK